ncbi:MAG: hypothetical protein ABIO38_00895 [Luteimonas sp.]
MTTPAKPPLAAQQEVRAWAASGGSVVVRWNHDLAADLGIRISTIGNASRLAHSGGERFNLDRAARLRFNVKRGYLHAFTGGALRARGGYSLDLGKGSIALSDFRLVPRLAKSGQNTQQFNLIGADGTAWFHVDRLMHELTEHDSRIAVRTSDIRISAALARRIGQPEVTGWAIGEVQFDAGIVAKGSGAMPLSNAITWHGDPAPNGDTYQNDLFMQRITAQYMRCNGCTGTDGSGDVVITPASTLRNNVNEGNIAATVPGDPLGTSTARYAASIPWYSKFSGNFAPYNNDQHPYLIWNMYRINADGSFEQIGRSGVKQAFLTTNGGCLDSGDYNSHVLGRGCEDTYSTSNNDFNNALSPRWEILPATGQWGRCGSTFDTNCDGVANASPATDDYYQRLIVDESQITPAAGTSWLLDSWYLARQDINIYNSMATVRTTQSWNGSVWLVGYDTQTLGPAIDRWVAPSPKVVGVTGTRRGHDNVPSFDAASMNRELVVNGAHAKVAVRANRIGPNLWRYHYAVMNFDFAFAETTGAEPNLRITSTRGFDGFSLATSAASSGTVFRDGDLDANNDWTFVPGAGSVRWNNAASPATTLGWGMLYSFSLTSNAPPRLGKATLHAAGAPAPVSYTVQTLVPSR